MRARAGTLRRNAAGPRPAPRRHAQALQHRAGPPRRITVFRLQGPQTSFPQDRQWCRRTVTPLKARSQTIQVAELPSAIHSGDDASRGGDSSASLAATASAATSARSAMPMASFMLVGRSCPEL